MNNGFSFPTSNFSTPSKIVRKMAKPEFKIFT